MDRSEFPGKPGLRGCGEMAEGGGGAACEKRGPPPAALARWPRTDDIDAGMNPLQLSRSEPVIDGAAAEAQAEPLIVSHRSMLAGSEGDESPFPLERRLAAPWVARCMHHMR